MRAERTPLHPTTVAVVVLALLVVLAGGVALGTVGAHDSSSDIAVTGGADHTTERIGADHTTGTTGGDIAVTNAMFLTDDRGTVGVTTTATVPDGLSELRITLRSANEEALETDGFVHVEDDDGDPVMEWDGTTDRPSVTYRTNANVTADPEGPLAEAGAYRFVDAGDWAIVRTPVLDVSWLGPPGTGVDRENAVDGPGVASQAMAFLGSHEEHVHEAGDQRFRLIVPDAADLDDSPERVFAAFEYASTALQVGARDDEVVAVAAPTGSVEWGVRGLQIGDADLWVLDDEPAGTADDVWTHEYVHTRQSYEPDESASWFTEASAMHYAALFALERGEADVDSFRRTLARGEREPDASAVLAEPATWTGPADYTKGALVAGEIDRQLRTATDGEASLATVFRDLNEAEEPVTIETFLDAVAAAAAEGGDDDVAAAVRGDAERYTTTEAVPAVWDRDEHEQAFGETPAQVGYGLASDGVRATGEYRDRSIDHDPVRIVADETLVLELSVRNTGGVAGDYEVALSVDGDVVDSRSGTVEGGDDVTERFEHGFAEPGEHELRIGSETLTVVVSEPADATVRNVTVVPPSHPDDGSVTAGDTITVAATVGSDAATPAGDEVEFRVDGEPVGSDPVRLDVGEETTLEREITLEEGGSTTITAAAAGGEAATTVEVDGGSLFDRPSDDASIGDTVGDVPGFGPAIAVIAVLSVTILARGRR